MPRLLKKVEGKICDNFETKVKIGGIKAELGVEDYIGIYGLTAYLQNYSKVSSIEIYPSNELFGLKTDKNIIELNISY